MKTIGNIYLTWRKGKSSRRFPVGVIKRNSTEGVRFNYIPQQVEEAKKFGFTPYEGFPDIDKDYTENVLSIFSQRLIRSERKDTSDFYKFWLIDKEDANDDYFMLAFTQGLSPIDNFEFLADFTPKKGLYFITEIAGLSYYNIESNSVQIGDVLTYEKEPTNERDINAVKVFKGSLFLGYIKTIHNRVFYKSKGIISLTVHHIEKNGTLNRVFLRVDI